MKSENKLEGDLNFRAWKTSIDLILAKNKVLDIMKGNIMEPQFEAGKEKEPQNIATLEKFKDNEINAMSIIVDFVKDHLIPYISHLDSSKKMYDALTNLFSIRNIGQVMSLKNELCDTKMTKDDTIASYFVRIYQLRYQPQAIEEAILEKEVVNIALNGLSRSWGREKKDITHQLPMMKNPQRRQSTMKQIYSIIRPLLEPLKMTYG
jgi:hypothetical protein